MKVPVSWLREFIDLGNLSVADLAARMTFAGIEIEGIATVGAAVPGVVVGEVVACERIPASAHLSRCRVFDGTDTLDVVCGAPNCAVGIKAPFAPVGTVLPGGLTIARRTLLGKYVSCGMLCAAAELGLSSDRDGLMLLGPTLPAGTPLTAVLGPPETVFDVEITWNRPDLLSILGVAREFAALLGRPVQWPAVDFAETDVPVASLAAVAVEDREGCPRYVARVLTDVRRVPSPDWMRRRLELCGQRAIDIVVDVANYVMLECGQPLHTFDYDRLAEHRIVVRRAAPGEALRTLDAQPRALDPATLVIADARAAVAVAGVMGGAGSEIGPDTRRVLLESATFDAPRIKHAATALGLRTESAHRFERGVDPGLAEWASRRATALLAQYAHAKVARGALDADFRPPTPRRVALRFQRVRDVIGAPMEADRMVALLAALAIPVVARDAACAVFAPPSYRGDLEHEADLVEELVRLHGLEALPDVRPVACVVPGADDPSYRAVVRCRHTLANLGLHEALHYSFLSAAELDAVTPSAAARRVVLPNPVSADYAVLRDSLLPQMIGTLGRNAARQTPVAALFELGRVFFRGAAGAAVEEERLAIGMLGPVGRLATDRARPVEHAEALLWLKGVLEALIDALHAPAFRLEPQDAEGFQPGWSARIVLDGQDAGIVGLVNKDLRHRWRVTTPMAVLEVRREALLGNVFRTPTARNVPAYPGTLRDIALLADAGVTHARIVATIRKAAPPELVDVRLFDIFQGAALGAGRSGLAYALEYRSSARTLRDEEANAFHEAVKAALRSELGVEIREG